MGDQRVKQLRDGVIDMIKDNPVVVTISRKSATDPYATTVITKARIRLSHESSSVQSNQVGQVGLSTNLSMYALTDYKAPLVEGDEITANSETWTVGAINTFRFCGYIYATEAPVVRRS